MTIDRTTRYLKISDGKEDPWVEFKHEIVKCVKKNGYSFAAKLERVDGDKLWFRNSKGLVTIDNKDDIISVAIIPQRVV